MPKIERESHEENQMIRDDSSLGMYLHVPFCSTTCDFCAFYQERPSKKDFETFFSGLSLEIEHISPDRPFSTIFIGGGTPGILSHHQIKKLGGLLTQLKQEPNLEWSVEIAPSEITRQKLEAFAEIGVNRISLGVQTFDSQLMKKLGRNHEVSKVEKAFSMIRETGFNSTNLDLIFGIPGQTLSLWEKDLIQAVEMEPDHLSTYCLTFEEDTALFVKLSQGKVSIDPEKEASFYERTWELLPKLGYAQYEISNFAQKGHLCRHNLNTWAMDEWIGYGPSAATQFQGIRRKNKSNLDHWAKQWMNFENIEFDEFTKLSAEDVAYDAVTFGLRMNQGVNLEEVAKKFSLSNKSFGKMELFMERLAEEHLMKKTHNWRLTPKGRLVADAIARDLPHLS